MFSFAVLNWGGAGVRRLERQTDTHFLLVSRSRIVELYIHSLIVLSVLCYSLCHEDMTALPHFMRSSESGTGSTQPREYN
jgi:hypothetical protein